jgi:choline dehydrogenase-like flavoprotein
VDDAAADPHWPVSEGFDYIVVGAGSAGCALAARLAEDASTTVALLESGPPDNHRVFEIPALFGQQQKSTFDWDLETEPEPALGRRRTYLPRGRVLGGTSSMNTMVYTRGSPADYDAWAAAGCDGWSYDEVLPYFRRSEDNERGESRYHGVGGPLAVSDGRSVPPVLERWVEAACGLGHPLNDDFNGAAQDGAGLYQMTQRSGLRCSSAQAFIAPLRGRENLRVLTSTHALRVVWSGQRAAGVEVEHLGTTRVLAARREIVLAAGAYLSPQLLMLSGVGPAEHLRAVGVEPLVDNAEVGANLQDHPGCFLSYLSRHSERNGVDTPANERRLREHGDGPLTWTEAGLFARTREDLPAPDLQFHAATGVFADEGLAEAFDDAISFGPYVTTPRSRGRVWLRSSLPQAKPRILHNYLSDPEDVRILREGVRIAMRIAAQPALAGSLKDVRLSIDAGLVPHSDRDDDIERFMRATAFSFFHPCGTCAMGAVVDSHLRVLGVDGLRVADTSVMPNLIRGNTNAPAIMIGERVSDFVAAAHTPSGSEPRAVPA